MAAHNGKVFARREADELCFLVVGQVTCHHSIALRQYAEEGLTCGATRVQVDLRDCTYCDSTFLGTLLQLHNRFNRRHQEAFRLVCPSAQLRKMLSQIGAEGLFCVVEHTTAADSQTTWQQLKDDLDRVGTPRFKKNVVEAHQELASAGGALASRFGPLAEALSCEIETQEKQSLNQRPSS